MLDCLLAAYEVSSRGVSNVPPGRFELTPQLRLDGSILNSGLGRELVPMHGTAPIVLRCRKPSEPLQRLGEPRVVNKSTTVLDPCKIV